MTPHPVVIEPDARLEIGESAAWYAERGADLAARMLDEVQDRVAAIGERPRRFPPIPGLPTSRVVRKARLDRFPYALIFVESPNAVRVVAFAHLRRRPLYWADRLES